MNEMVRESGRGLMGAARIAEILDEIEEENLRDWVLKRVIMTVKNGRGEDIIRIWNVLKGLSRGEINGLEMAVVREVVRKGVQEG